MPVDRDWSREVGDLKCATCGKVTQHALIHPDGDTFRDHAERLSDIALGMADTVGLDVRERITTAYRVSNYPANPYVNHKWWKSAENDARRSGKAWFRAMCGELVEVPEQPCEGTSITEMQAPTQCADPDRASHENLDVDTGLRWSGGTCINCLRVRNAWLLQKRRTDLALMLVRVAAQIEDVDAETVTRLADLVDSVVKPGGEQ